MGKEFISLFTPQYNGAAPISSSPVLARWKESADDRAVDDQP
jgi:hypothetical protein